MRISWSDVECGGVVGERGVGCGLKEKDTVRFLESRQVEQVRVLVEPIPDRTTVWELDHEKLVCSRDILRHVDSWSPGDNDQVMRIPHASVSVAHQPASESCDSHVISHHGSCDILH